jgi:hypothetical protein
MTVTLDDVTPMKRKPEPSAEEVAAAELVRQAKEQGLSLTGPDGVGGGGEQGVYGVDDRRQPLKGLHDPASTHTDNERARPADQGVAAAVRPWKPLV